MPVSLDLSWRSFERFLWPFVGLVVEVTEQEVEKYGVHSDPPDEGTWVIAVDEEQLEGVNHYENELNHLQAGEVLLPPEVGLNSGSKRGQQVVTVHDDVNEAV